jgi:AraC family transcriptional regulator
MGAYAPFKLVETHGILARPGNEIRATSNDFNWTSIYASSQKEMPFEANFGAVKDQLIVLHRDGPVSIDGRGGDVRFRRTVPAGGIHLVPGGAEFDVRLAAQLNTLHVYIRRSVIEDVAAQMVEGDPSRIEIAPQIIDEDPSFLSLLDAVDLALNDGDDATALYADFLSQAIAAHLIRRYSHAARFRVRRTAQSGGILAQAVAEAIEYMRENLDRPISLNDIAASVNRSPSHFAREFRSDLGVPPHCYLIDLRLDKAKHLLEKTNTPIAEIPYECGFSHQEHLTRLFRRRCNTTPAVYRKSKRN